MDSLTLCLDIVDELGVDVIPYIVLLVVPILGCMSDQTASVRLMATSCFATLIRLMPLEVYHTHMHIHSTVICCLIKWGLINENFYDLNFIAFFIWVRLWLKLLAQGFNSLTSLKGI